MEVTTAHASEDRHLVVPSDATGMRLDVFLLGRLFPDWTRGEVQRAIRNGRITIAGKQVVKPSTLLRQGQNVHVSSQTWAERMPGPAETPMAGARLPPLNILHEDPALLALEKPAGFPVHHGVRREPSLVDALVARYPGVRGVGENPQRPGIVHRLDKETSGVLLVARTPEMYEHLKREFQQRRVRKEYLALVHGVVSEAQGSVKLPIVRSRRNPLRRTIARTGEGKDAETFFRVLERFREHTLLAVYPKTGRMHQIRVHLNHLGFPVAGDPLYGRKSRHRTPPGLRRQFLHAYTITVKLPSEKMQTFTSPLPKDLATVLAELRDAQSRPAVPLGYRWRSPRGPQKK